jgi:hypothetical protein
MIEGRNGAVEAEARYCLYWIYGMTKQLAENGGFFIDIGEKNSAGAKAHLIFMGCIGTTEVMPCYKARLAGAKARVIFDGIIAGDKSPAYHTKDPDKSPEPHEDPG